MLEPFLEGQTMDAALAAKRIFIVDLEILSRLKLDENKKVGNLKTERSECLCPGAPNRNILLITVKFDATKIVFVASSTSVPLGRSDSGTN